MVTCADVQKNHSETRKFDFCRLYLSNVYLDIRVTYFSTKALKQKMRMLLYRKYNHLNFSDLAFLIFKKVDEVIYITVFLELQISYCWNLC